MNTLVLGETDADLTAFEAALTPLGHPVVTARWGEERLQDRLQSAPGVIVMDVRTPGVGGHETSDLIEQLPLGKDVSVVLLTAAGADVEELTRGYTAKAVEHIAEPIDLEALRSKVATLLELQREGAELRESEERFRAAFEDAPVGMGLSTLDGRWLEVNPALCDLLGRSRERLDQPLWQLAHPADLELERDAWQRLLRDQPRLDQSEKRFVRPDGEVVHALVTVSLTLDARGGSVHYIWQVVDVTEQRRAEADRAGRAEAEAMADTIGKLQHVTEAALEHLELRELMTVLVDRLREVFRADLARILLIEPGRRGQLALGAASGFDPEPAEAAVPLGDALLQVVGEGRPLIMDEQDAGAGLDPMLASAGPRAVMASPLTVKGHMAGVVDVASREPRQFTSEEESLLVLMADRAGLAIEHARAYEREVGTVEMLQRSLLPDRLPTLPRIRIAARYLPGGADVGGDWYDAIPLEGGALGVAIGDVVGHGIAAASLMGQLRHAARAYALEGHSPGAVLDRLDRLVRGLEGAQMATLLYLVVDAGLTSVRFASAGHVPPLAIGADGQPRFLDAAPDPPLGVFDTPAHAELSAELEPGSTLVLYTDGLVEQRGVPIDEGLEALRAVAERPGDPEELCDELVDSMLAIHPANDDMAILVLQATSAAAERLHLEVSTDPTLLGEVRRDLARWLRRTGAGKEEIEVIQIACHEACSNAIEHGYRFGDATFTIDAELDDGRVVLEVRDRGRWVDRVEGRLPYRGRGLSLMEALMDEVELSHEGGGTMARMELRLSAEPVPAAS